MPGRCSVAVDAVDVYARGAIDRIAHRINVEFSNHAVFGTEYGHELDAGRFGENIDRPATLDIETGLVGDNTESAWGGRAGTPDLAETSCSRMSIPFITIPLCGAGPCAAVCGRQRPSPEAALFDSPGCDRADMSKAAMKVTRRTILALTREL
jgi:hypothetical protein